MVRAWTVSIWLLVLACAPAVAAGKFDVEEEDEPSVAAPKRGLSGKLLATGGLSAVEGAAGGGIVPWALVGGYGTKEQVGAAAFFTHINAKDYRLSSAGLALAFLDRLELSFAHQAFDLVGTVLPGNTIKQQVFGAKLRLIGDAVFAQDDWLPQLALGVQHKRNLDFDFIPRAVGARHAGGTDVYLAAAKLFLGAAAGRNLLVNSTVRATKANQIGLLGFGGDKSGDYRLQWEGSVGVFLNESTALGAEYRMKPDSLSAHKEEDWADAFVAYFPNKNLAVTAAYARLGKIAGKDQNGLYFSVQAGF